MKIACRCLIGAIDDAAHVGDDLPHLRPLRLKVAGCGMALLVDTAERLIQRRLDLLVEEAVGLLQRCGALGREALS
jgi:hypothetical protein